MSEHIACQTGPYMHGPNASFKKVFTSLDGASKRTFTVLIAGARNAGIIGPEDNGIVVLDEDNGCVVLDNHLEQDSGYFGPSRAQTREVERILAMPWREFMKFCGEHPRYRAHSIPEVEASLDNHALRFAPEYRLDTDLLPDIQLIDDATLAADANVDVTYPVRDRHSIIKAIAGHHVHSDRHSGGWRLAWDIKVHRFDTSGKVGDFKPVDWLDRSWEIEVEQDHTLFGVACEDALRPFLEGDYTTYPGNDSGEYGFGTQGRSGGHLVLTKLGGLTERELTWGSQKALAAFLEGLSDAELTQLYRLTRHVDHSVDQRHQEMAYQFGFQRSLKEEAWELKVGSMIESTLSRISNEGLPYTVLESLLQEHGVKDREYDYSNLSAISVSIAKQIRALIAKEGIQNVEHRDLDRHLDDAASLQSKNQMGLGL